MRRTGGHEKGRQGMKEKQAYRFIFRFDDGEYRQVRREITPGRAEQEARVLAARAAKAVGAETAVCVWMGPIIQKVPARVRAEIAGTI